MLRKRNTGNSWKCEKQKLPTLLLILSDFNKMKKLSIIITILLSFSVNAQQSLSLEECYSLADTNYPIARQTELLKNKTDLEISVLEKGKLPKVDLNAQATYQSEVIEFPFQLPNSTVEPLNKDQYRATLDVNQLIYNGGS